MKIYIRSALYCLIVLSFAVTMVACIDKLIIKTTTYYTVTFNSNGGSEVASQKVENGGTVTKLEAPLRDGYEFKGWYTDETFQQQFDFTTAITENITLYAKWAELSTALTVTFNSNGGSEVASQKVENGDTVTEPEAPSRDGYEFGGWYADETLQQKFDFINTAITGDITLYAKWDLLSFTVTFNSNGGSAVAQQEIENGSAATEPEAPSRDGYEFGGWYADETLQQKFDFINTAITDNITLYAKWDLLSFTVTFNSNGGNKVASQEVENGSAATEPEAPSRDGYEFGGWYADETLQQKFDFINTAITDNITLYAKWTRTTLTVTFNTNGGNDITSQNIEYGSSIAAPDNVLHSCYTRSRWYTDSTFTAAFNFGIDLITEDTTLFAKWDESTTNTDETPIASQSIYQICNWKQLQWIAKDPERLDDDYILVKDIVLPKAREDGFPVSGFIPIGYDVNPNNSSDAKNYEGTPFSGTFDGNNKTISNLFINAQHTNWTSYSTLIPDTILDDDFIGLFGHINRTESDPAVKNLTIILATDTQDNPSIDAKTYVGGLVGLMTNGVIENVAIKDGYIQGQTLTGGLIGWMEDGEVRGYNANTTIRTNNQNVVLGIGGLVGQAAKGTIVGYATGNIIAPTAQNVGGLVGYANATIIGYATGSVEGSDSVGGLVGTMTGGSITGYATGLITTSKNAGGLVASATNSTIVGYWDAASTKNIPSANGIGISATQNIVFNDKGYVDNQGTPDIKDDVVIFNEDAFTEQFDVINGTDATWPKLKTTVFALPQPTISNVDQDRVIEVVFPAE